MFDTLISNSRMKEELTRSISQNRTMQAYLFCGPKGSGKMTAAKLFASQLVGTGADKVLRGTHPDVFVLEPEKDRKLITVAQIRDMRSDAFVSPSEAVRKVYIINGMQLTNEQGQNALLTILEQPPSFSVFILLSESKDYVLPTVISRCAVFEMEYVDAQTGADFLQKEFYDTPREKLMSAMQAAQGNIGLARELISEIDTRAAECERIMLAAANGDEYTVAKILTAMQKDKLCSILSTLATYLRDIAMLRCGADRSELVFKKSVLQNSGTFDKISLNMLYDCIQGCETGISRLDANISPTLVSATTVILLCGGKIN